MSTNKVKAVLATFDAHPDWSSYRIGGYMSLHPSYVRATLSRNGRHLARKTKSKNLQDWERQAILDAYRDGEKLEAIAAEFGCTIWAVYKAAKRAGIPMRRK